MSDLTKLKELCALEIGTSLFIEDEEGLPLVLPEDLNKKTNEFYFTPVSKNKVLPLSNSGSISAESVLICLNNNNLSAVIFRPTSDLQSIFLSSDIYALIPDPDKLLPTYLLSQIISLPLSSKFLEALFKPVERMRIEALLNLEILIPTINDQLGVVKNSYEEKLVDETQRLKEQIKKQKEIEAEELFIRGINHSLLPHLSRCHEKAKKLIDFYADNPNLLNEKVNRTRTVYRSFFDQEMESNNSVKFKTETVGTSLQTLVVEIEFITKILKSIKEISSIRVTEDELSVVNIYSFIKDRLDFLRESFNIDERIEFIIEESDIQVRLHEGLFSELLNNILMNCKKHAFKSILSNIKYFIEFTFSLNGDNLEIHYKNNGEKFSISPERFIQLFERSRHSDGSGLGGFIINRIIKAHKGEFIIKSDYNGTYFIFVIPLKGPSYE